MTVLRIHGLLPVAAFLALCPNLAAAQDRFEVGLTGRHAFSSDDIRLDGAFGAGARLGFRVLPRLVLEGEGMTSRPALSSGSVERGAPRDYAAAQRLDFTVRAVYHQPVISSVHALLGAGYTYSQAQSVAGQPELLVGKNSFNNAQALAGLRMQLTSRFSVRAEGTYNVGSIQEPRQETATPPFRHILRQWGAQIGLSFGFGNKATGPVSDARPTPMPRPTPAPVLAVSVDTLPTVREEANDAAPVRVLLTTVHFSYDRAVLTPIAKQKIRAAADSLQAQQQIVVELVGHTDSRGTESYNQRLSELRARAVRDYMVSIGIAVNRLTSSGRGELEPIGDNKTAEGRAQNRRVEVIGEKP